MADSQNNFVVRLIPFTSLTFGDAQSILASQVVFNVTPSFAESRSVEYSQVTPVHLPGGMQIYKRTNSRTFTIGAHLISRNVADALTNIQTLQKLRGWTMPYFGMTDTVTDSQFRALDAQSSVGQSQGINQQATQANGNTTFLQRVISEGIQLRGAPPDLLYLYAYSTSKNDKRNPGTLTNVNINRIPVVLTNLDIQYPDDVDYLPVFSNTDPGPTDKSEPFPIRMDVNITLAETHSPLEYEKFDLMAYKQGNLQNF